MISERTREIPPSETLKITSLIKKLKKESKPVINFAAGEPDFDTPSEVKQEAKKAIDAGFTKYTPVAGILELREAISQKFKSFNKLDYSPDQIVVSNGAKHSIFNVLFSILNSNEEVIILSPYWLSYPQMVKLAGGRPLVVEFRKEEGFRPAIDEIEKNISPRTKCILLNSPVNPTGIVWRKEELEKLAELVLRHNLFVISDEIYEHLVYQGEHYSIGAFSKEIYSRTITVSGVSKSYSMTGWRIGWVGAPIQIAREIIKVQSHTTSNPSSISQLAALRALRLQEDWHLYMKEEFRKRRDFLSKELKEANLSFITPEGAFYLFLDISASGMDSISFSGRLLEEKFVGVIPGRPFGRDDFVRISYATSLEEIKEGTSRIREFLYG